MALLTVLLKKRIIISIAIAIILAVVLKTIFMVKNYQQNSFAKYKVRVAVKLDDFNGTIDPIRNPTLTNAFFVNHLYSNLITVDNDNNYKPELCEKISWNDNNITFHFAPNSRITPKDAQFSIIRTFFNTKNDHGNLWKLICLPEESENNCFSRILTEENTLKIKIHDPKNADLIIPILASINYKIIPQSAFDSNNPATAKIIDYTNTSGKFYMSNFPNLMKANIPHSTFDEVEIVNGDSNSILDLAQNDKIDVISSTITIFEKDYDKLKNIGWSFDKTHNIKVTLIVFSMNAINNLSVEERHLITKIINQEADKNKALFSEKTNQYFQNFALGYLSENQTNLVKETRSSDKISHKINFSINNVERWKNAFKDHPKVSVSLLNSNPLTTSDNKRPDIFVMTNDVSFETSFSQLSYLLFSEIFKSKKYSKEDFLQLFINSNAIERVSLINEIHFENIKNNYIAPIWASPYITATNKKLKSKNSKFNSASLVWNLTKN